MEEAKGTRREHDFHRSAAGVSPAVVVVDVVDVAAAAAAPRSYFTIKNSFLRDFFPMKKRKEEGQKNLSLRLSLTCTHFSS